MGYLLHVLAALLVIGVGESALGADQPRPLGIAALLAVPHLLAAASRAAGRRGGFRRASALDRLLQRSAPLAFAVAVLALGWTRVVEDGLGWNPGILSWPGPGLLVTLAPYVLLELLVIDARARLVTGSDEARRQVAAYERRMFAASCVPFALYVGFAASIGASDRVRIPLEEVGLWNTAFTVASLGAFVLILPSVLRRTFATAPLLPGGLRTLLETVAVRAGFRFRELLVWRTGNRMANAAVVGLTGRQRYVLFSDALLRELTPREIAAVFAHEIGHAVRHHAPFFVLTLACMFFSVQLALRLAPAGDLLVESGVLVLVFVVWALGFGYLSRRFELEADLVSLELIGDPEPLASALSHVTGAHAHEKSSWRHFSTARRIAFLERATLDARVGGSLRARLLRARRAFALAFVVLLGAELWFLLGDFPGERTVVALRLGEYAEARSLLPDDADEDLARVVARTQELGDVPATAEELERRGREALGVGDVEQALDWIDLASLRGAGELDPVRAALRLLARDEPLLSADMDELPEDWRLLLRAADRSQATDERL